MLLSRLTLALAAPSYVFVTALPWLNSPGVQHNAAISVRESNALAPFGLTKRADTDPGDEPGEALEKPMTFGEWCSLFELVNARLSQRTDIYVMGGLSAVVLGARETTKDCDYLVSPDMDKQVLKQLEDAIIEVGKSKNLYSEWMNRKADGLFIPHEEIVKNSPMRMWGGDDTKLRIFHVRMDVQLLRKMTRISAYERLAIDDPDFRPYLQPKIDKERKDAAYFVHHINTQRGSKVGKADFDLVKTWLKPGEDFENFGVQPVNNMYKAEFGNQDAFQPDLLTRDSDVDK